MNLLDKEFLLVDKPAGLSSFAVVARIRRILTEQMKEDYAKRGLQAPKRAKVGHAGTLDPFATGLLICLLGKGTKRAGEFLKKDKRYQATICLGKTSSTGDVEGEISEYRISGVPAARPVVTGASPTCAPRWSHRPPETHIPNNSTVASVVQTFQGKIRQRVPAYSAVKINGRRPYLGSAAVEVHSFPKRKSISPISREGSDDL